MSSARVFILLNFAQTFMGLVDGYFWEVVDRGGLVARVWGMRYEFELPYPPSLNSYYRHVGAKVLISEKGRAYRAEVERVVRYLRRAGRVPAEPMSGELVVEVYIDPPDKRTRDVDNLPKSVLDALTKSGLWSDDGEIYRLVLERRREVVRGGRLTVCVDTI